MKPSLTEQFFNDVVKGLNSKPKYLQSKYFYDAEGDDLFQQIMNCDEYYLTRCEMEIFTTQTKALAKTLLERHKEFDIVELGAGDATKSTHLLKYLSDVGLDYTYFPIDISGNVIELLENELPERIDDVQVHGLKGEYLHQLKKANKISDKRKVVLFLGSNIGNYNSQEALKFLQDLHEQMMEGDLLLISFDLKKNPKQILAAYNDAAGITKAFNLNLLKRINKELDANFAVDQFDHFPTYDPLTGACKSYLFSLKKQVVKVRETEVEFEENEPIYMELSQKYSLVQINAMAKAAGFEMFKHFQDKNSWFVDAVWERI